MSLPIECDECGWFITEKGLMDCGKIECQNCSNLQEYHGIGCEGNCK